MLARGEVLAKMRSSIASSSDSTASSLLEIGGPERISLAYWRKTLDRSSELPIRSFLVFLFENLLLSQHFAVAAGRFDGTVQRLRIAIEEEGLVSMVHEPWKPIVTPDRLATALSLASECGVIEFDEESKRYRAPG